MCNQFKKSLGNRKGGKTAINLLLTNIIFNPIHTWCLLGRVTRIQETWPVSLQGKKGITEFQGDCPGERLQEQVSSKRREEGLPLLP